MNEESTIIEKLDYLEGTKTSIKNAIISKGQEVTENDTFRSYAQKIAAIETGIDTSDATATAEDIKAGKTAYVDGEKIEGIHVDEDLTSVLNAQDQKIAELEAALENKTAGGKVKLNIFAQTTEPEEKDGIWLQTDKTFDKIYFDEQVKTLLKENYDTTKEYPNITLDSAEYGHALPAIGMGDFVYVFANSKIYKYDSTNRTCESIKSIWGDFSGNKSSACLVGTDIFIFKYNTIYKYDTINETLTTEKNVGVYDGGILVSISSTSEYIYLLYETNIYKYDIKNKSISTLSLKLPYTFSNYSYHRMPCVIGDLVYLFGNINSSNHRKSYVLDLKNEVITQIKDLPVTMNFAISACQVDGYIYVIQGPSNSTSSVRYAVKYDIVNDTYTTIALNTRSVYAYANYAYLVNGTIVCVSDTSNNIYFDHFTVSYDAIYNYENNSVVVWDGFGKYKTQLTKSAENQEGKIQTLFYDAYHYTTENGLDDTIPTYYGDGTQWIKFKN